MRAGNAAARDTASSISALGLDEPEVVAFEIETFESTVLFEPLDNKAGGRASGVPGTGMERGSTQGRGFQAEKKPVAPERDKPRTTRPPSILDPLFDEDD